jgi:predicted solute-binding protein
MVSGEYASVTEMYHVWYGLGHYTDLPLPGGINALEKQASKWRDVDSRSGRTIEGRKKRANLNALRKIVRAVVNRQNVSDESLAMTLREFDQLFRNTRKKGMLQTRRKGMLQLIQMLKAKKFIEGQQSSLTVDPPVGHQEYCSLLVIP